MEDGFSPHGQEEPLGGSGLRLRMADVSRAAPKYVTELKTPYMVDDLCVLQRRLPDGLVIAKFGPFACEADAERFVVDRLRQRELKSFQVGDNGYDDDA